MSFRHLANFSLSETFCFKYVSHIWQRVVLCLRAKVKIFSFYLGAFWLIYILYITDIFSLNPVLLFYTIFTVSTMLYSFYSLPLFSFSNWKFSVPSSGSSVDVSIICYFSCFQVIFSYHLMHLLVFFIVYWIFYMKKF